MNVDQKKIKGLMDAVDTQQKRILDACEAAGRGLTPQENGAYVRLDEEWDELKRDFDDAEYLDADQRRLLQPSNQAIKPDPDDHSKAGHALTFELDHSRGPTIQIVSWCTADIKGLSVLSSSPDSRQDLQAYM